MKKSELLKYVRYWQGRLKLLDWYIEIKVEELDGRRGEVEYNLELREAYIRINPTEDFKIRTVEMTVVHEMLHLVLAAWHDFADSTITPTAYSVCCEQPINGLSELLVNQRYEKV